MVFSFSKKRNTGFPIKVSGSKQAPTTISWTQDLDLESIGLPKKFLMRYTASTFTLRIHWAAAALYQTKYTNHEFVCLAHGFLPQFGLLWYIFPRILRGNMASCFLFSSNFIEFQMNDLPDFLSFLMPYGDL